MEALIPVKNGSGHITFQVPNIQFKFDVFVHRLHEML